MDDVGVARESGFVLEVDFVDGIVDVMEIAMVFVSVR